MKKEIHAGTSRETYGEIREMQTFQQKSYGFLTKIRSFFETRFGGIFVFY